jgi:hypothetical protein
MLTGFSEPLALIPYLLRSLRIKKLFECREVYCDTDKMPKDEIWDWREDRVIKLLVGLILGINSIGLIVFLIGLAVSGYNSETIPNNWNVISTIMGNENG